MPPLLCRIILVDLANRRPLWDACAAAAHSATLTPLDPQPFAAWDVSALAAVYQVGAGPCALADILPTLAHLQACKCRLCFTRQLDQVLVFLEKKERTPVDVAAMRQEIDQLFQAAFPPADDDTPWPTAERPTENAATNAAAPPSGVCPVMLVEDEVMVRSYCQRVLAPLFLVCEVGDSFDALALAERLPFPIHVLVSDVSLPRMDGVALARRWCERDREARVLLLSGNPHAAAAAPEFSFLQKPFAADDLVRRVQQLAQPVEKVAQH